MPFLSRLMRCRYLFCLTARQAVSLLTVYLLCCLAAPVSWGGDSFKVDTIHITGLQKLSQEAVLSQLPIQSGQWFDTSQSESVTKKLYKTQWFDEVQLSRQGSQLEIVVKERPMISQLVFKGNHGIPEDSLESLLKSVGLVAGEFFNPTALAFFEKMLVDNYKNAGHHAAQVVSSLTNEREGSVTITIELIPGPTLKFSTINLVGNQAFSKKSLLAVLPVSTCRPWSPDYIWALITNKLTHCTQQVRKEALNALRLFYQNQGYLAIKIDASRLHITPDRRYAEWTLELTEGPIYKVGNYRILGHLDEASRNQLEALIDLQPNTTYSKEKLSKIRRQIDNYFDSLGYMNAEVTIVPSVDHNERVVSFAIQVDPKQKIYTRYIDISGNRYTQNWLLRSLIPQEEASLLSTQALNDSKKILLRSGFVKDVQIKLVPVDDASDQVDLNINVDESSRNTSFNPSLNLGEDGLHLFSDLKIENMLGRGEDLKFNLSKTWEESSLHLYYQKKCSDILGLKGATWSLDGYATSPDSSWYKKKGPKDTSTPRKSEEESKKSSDGLPETGATEQPDPLAKGTYKHPINSNGTRFDLFFPSAWSGYAFRVGTEFKSHHLRELEEKEKAREETRAVEAKKFLASYGPQVDQWTVRGGIRVNTLEGSNRFFPNKGEQSDLLLSLSLSCAGSVATEESILSRLMLRSKIKKPLNYWKFDYSGFRFWNIYAQHVIGINWRVGVGQQLTQPYSNLPFFDSYSSGRFPGFKYDSLGYDKNSYPTGGTLIKARAMYCLPKPFSGDYLHFEKLPLPYRSSLFCQVGNVYDNLYGVIQDLQKNKGYLPYSLSIGAAIEVELRLPMLGTLPAFASVAWPVLSQSDHKKSVEYFNVGINFSSS